MVITGNRTEQEIVDGSWPSMTVTKKEYTGEWPFTTDRVVLELQRRHLCVININDTDYSLNGMAISHLKLPAAPYSKVVIKGITIRPFIALCLSMGVTNE